MFVYVPRQPHADQYESIFHASCYLLEEVKRILSSRISSRTLFLMCRSLKGYQDYPLIVFLSNYG